MKSFVKFCINKRYWDLLKNKCQCYSMGKDSVSVLLPFDDVKNIDYIHQINEKTDNNLYYDWDVVYNYSDIEIDNAELFHVKINNVIEPCGEECGTKYDDNGSCPICGAGRKQISTLNLTKIPSLKEYDIFKTISGEIIVSERFCELVFNHKLCGLLLQPILINKKKSLRFMQLDAVMRVDISKKTRFGIDFFDTINIPQSSEKKINICGHEIAIPKEIYVCPNKDLMGLRLLSELYIKKHPEHQCDFMKTSQYVGVRRGLLQPEPLYLCSKKFFDIVKENNISGLSFSIVKLSEN